MHEIGYLGPPGTFTEEALLNYKSFQKEDVKEYKTIPEVIRSIGKEVKEGIVPVENSLEGSVNITLDILAGENNLKIKREIVIPISHHLLVKNKTELNDIATLFSHYQAVAQCRRFIEQSMPEAETELTFSTAQAAKIVSEKTKKNCAAIGTLRAANLYNLKVLRNNISDHKCNYTRFIVLSHQEASPITGKDKTSVIFGIKDGPGALYQILKEFALREINLTKIESRPSKKNFGDYLFFVDMQGHFEEPGVSKGIEAIKDNTVFLKVLGSYPEAELSEQNEGSTEVEV